MTRKQAIRQATTITVQVSGANGTHEVIINKQEAKRLAEQGDDFEFKLIHPDYLVIDRFNIGDEL